MNGESVFGWIKAGGVLLVVALVAFVVWKFYGTFKGLFGGLSDAWAREKAAFAKRKAEFVAGENRPPDAPYTVKENPAGAATGIVLPMRRRATGTSSDSAGANVQPNAGFMDLYL